MLKNYVYCIFLPKMRVYRRDFDKTKYMFFWKKVSNIFGKEPATLSKKNLTVNLYTIKNI